MAGFMMQKLSVSVTETICLQSLKYLLSGPYRNSLTIPNVQNHSLNVVCEKTKGLEITKGPINRGLVK
jgi:hypothetical protein